MKTVRPKVIVCLALLILTLAAYAGEDFSFPIYHRVSGYGFTNTWFVAESRFVKKAEWDEKGEPRLSVGKAVSLAKAWVVSKGGEPYSYVSDIEFRSVDRGAPLGSPSKLRPFWFYVIRFHEVYLVGSSMTCILKPRTSCVISTKFYAA